MRLFQKRAQAFQNEKPRAERRERTSKRLALYLDDLLMIAGSICLIAAAALRWGAAAGLAVCGGCLAVFSVLAAMAKRR